MNVFIVSATTRDAHPEPVEMAWTRTRVMSEAQAVALTFARNKAEMAANSNCVWGYYEDTSDQPTGQIESTPL